MSGQSPLRDVSAESGPATSIASRLARRLARPVDAAARARAALHLLDWTGCAIAGARSPGPQSLFRAVGDDPLARALRLGAIGNVLEMDDVDKRALLHPGPVVAPAAIVAAEAAGADGGALLDAIVRGYEAMIRVGRAVGPSHYAFWHNTATCGPFGAAAAAASLIGLDAEQTADALGLAGTQAAGLWQVRHEPLSHAKQLHAAHAAHAGLLAARLVAEGFVGLRTIFEGPQGFFAAMCEGATPEAILADEREGPAIFDVSFKPWPACRHAHAAIDAALALRRDGARADDFEEIIVHVYRDAILFCDRPEPRDTLSAKFSLQHAVAATLVRGAPDLADFEADAIADPAIAALRARIRVVEDPALSARYPVRFGASLTARDASGARRVAEAPDALGDPENPAPATLIRDKARRLMRAGGMSAIDAEGLVDATLALADKAPLSEFLRRLEGAIGR